ncbi:MAG: DamX protein [Alteromonadaceae bacterium]|nr:DamX protein [Alteromonadaceae bacterium]MBB18685.1 DamX protein [Rickettsiales bacterium]
MQSELHKRLSHLIQYSSGLIFVKSEPDFSVSTCVDALLAEQDDSDEVAVIAAKPNMMLNDFRQQLTQQLSSKLAPNSGNTPLAKILTPGIGHFQSVSTQGLLICISKGENLSASMLQELQQLVLTLHAGSDRQVNVLVFAQRQWINQTYQALGDKNNVIVVDVGASAGSMADHEANISGSELEQLIANKRQAFAQRIEQRNQATPVESPSIMQRPWFIPVIALLFVAIFASILLSQYPELLSDSDNQTGDTTSSISALESGARQDETASTSVVDTLPQGTLTNQKNIESGPSATKEARTSNPNTSVQSAATEERAVAKPEVTPEAKTDALISNWQSESERIDANKNKSNELPADDTSSSPKATKLAAKPKSTNGMVQTGTLQKPFAADITPQADTAKTPSLNALSTTTDYAFDEATILALPQDGYVLQVIGFSVRSAIETYLTNNKIEQHVWVYQTKRYNNDWYVLLYNKHYPSLAAALVGVSSLPKGLHEATPFPKALQKVHQEIESAN